MAKIKGWKILFFMAIFGLLTSPAGAGTEDSLSTWLKSMMNKVVIAAEQKLTQTHTAGEPQTAVAGLRGDEQRGDQLEPYWKGDLTSHSTDYKAYRAIEASMQEGQYQQALKKIAAFEKNFAKSKLMPEVQFTKGLAYAGLGNQKAAVQAFQSIIDHYPEHDLVSASREGIARLKKA